jgi:hypothetical protein
VFDFAATKLLRVAATIGQGGDALVYMATSNEIEDTPAGGFYATEVTKNCNYLKFTDTAQIVCFSMHTTYSADAAVVSLRRQCACVCILRTALMLL